MLDSLLESVVHDAADAGCTVALLERSGCDVEVRPQALQRCLANLLENAIKHAGSAEVSARQVNGVAEVRIRDHGPGIPPDQLEAVFEPFVRLGSTHLTHDDRCRPGPDHRAVNWHKRTTPSWC